MTATTQSRTNSLQLVYWLMAVYFIDAAYAFSPLVTVPSLGEFLCLTILWEIHLSLGDMLKFFVSARKKESLFSFPVDDNKHSHSLPIYAHVYINNAGRSNPKHSTSMLFSSLQERATEAPKAPATKTRKRVKKKKATVRSSGPGRSLTKEELDHHVHERYSAIPSNHLDTALGDQQKQRQREQVDQYTKLLNGCPALVLNADYQPLSYLPLSLWSWQDAIKAIFSGKVTVVDTYPDVSIRAANLEVPLPSVIALNEYVPVGSHRPAFTRRNVFLRDGYTCQYCSKRYHTSDLSLDHVVPRSQGGILSW